MFIFGVSSPNEKPQNCNFKRRFSMKLCFQTTKLMELFMQITKVIYRVFLRFQKLQFFGGSKKAFLGSLLKLSTETWFFQHSLLTITFSFAVKKSNIKVNLKVNFGGFQKGIFGILMDIWALIYLIDKGACKVKFTCKVKVTHCS